MDVEGVYFMMWMLWGIFHDVDVEGVYFMMWTLRGYIS